MRSRMVYRALVQRPAVGTTDPDGHPSYNGWTTLHSALPIYFWEHKTKERFTTGQTAVVGDYMAVVPYGTDVKVTDRINGFKLRNGSVFSSLIFRVDAVIPRGLSHIELDLKLVTS